MGMEGGVTTRHSRTNNSLEWSVSTLGQMSGVCLPPSLPLLCPKYPLRESVFTPAHSCEASRDVLLCQRGFPKEMAKEDSRFEDFPKGLFLKAGSQTQDVHDAQNAQCIQGAQDAKDAQGF